MSTLDDTPSVKRCTKCGTEYPATPEYFHRDKSKSSGLRPQCKGCVSLKHRVYYETHAEHMKQKTRAWYEANPERAAQRRREYYAQNREAFDAKARKWSAENPEKRREIVRRSHTKRADKEREYARQWRADNRQKWRESKLDWYYRNREKAAAQHKEWMKSNPDKNRAYHDTRRARKANSGGTYTSADIRAQLKRQKGRCYWCGEKVTDYHVDHVIPLSRGGSNGPDNLVIACAFCNISKKDRLPHEWDGNGGRMF